MHLRGDLLHCPINVDNIGVIYRKMSSKMALYPGDKANKMTSVSIALVCFSCGDELTTYPVGAVLFSLYRP